MSKSIWLVGGNSGIGLETAKLLMAKGHQVGAAARTPGPLVEMGIPTQRFDASSPAELRLPECLDGLVYFPGSITLKPFHRLSDEDFFTDFQTNFMGAVRVIRAALPALKASGDSSIVLFSSVAACQGMPYHASVAAAKAAIEGMAKSLAAEFAPKIRVNVIAPSLTDTPLASALLGSDAKREASGKRHPLQRVGSAREVAALVDFLLTGPSGFLTGQVLRPDGGLSSLRTF